MRWGEQDRKNRVIERIGRGTKGGIKRLKGYKIYISLTFQFNNFDPAF
jgi:hypothetical protein